MTGPTCGTGLCALLAAAAHHPKLDDLSSISCLLSMRLCRHANNRKFALTGIDQQPLTVSRDSEASHGGIASARSERWAFIPYSETLSYPRDCLLLWVIGLFQNWLQITAAVTDLPGLWVAFVFGPPVCVCLYRGEKSHVSRVSRCRWATFIWLRCTSQSL